MRIYLTNREITVGRGHDPADAVNFCIKYVFLNDFDILHSFTTQYSNLSGGVMTPPYKEFLQNRCMKQVLFDMKDAASVEAASFVYYIFSGAEKPSRSMQFSRMSFARPMRAM